ncbi:MAG: sulfatase-like hydrolase/transferase [Verrucomicrobiales bacterium]|nr:sulfatase-like hydrolase/transferase [Verrucomicrobiales bacterium]
MAESKRPNILWYCTDQQRFDTIAALGNPHVLTPNIDKLVEGGVSFTHTYCQSPICTPSRSSFMTGLYPARLHNTRNGNATFPEQIPLISRLIADQGYDCGMIGKFHLQSSGHRTEPRIKEDGFRYWKFSHAPRDDWPEGEHDYADWVRENGGDLNAMRESEDNVPREFHQTTWATTRAIEFISEERADQPWMLNINVYDPHPPFIPPKDYADKFDPNDMPGPTFEPSDVAAQEKLVEADFQTTSKPPEETNAKEAQAKYYAMIALIDDEFGRLMDHLESTGQIDNTVVIFTSDHGETLGDHGLFYKGCRFYEGLTRVPLIFYAPGRFGEGVECDQLTELLDMSASLLEIAGAETPDYHQGQSLLPYLKGEKLLNEPIRDAARSEYFDALAPAFTQGKGTFATMYRDKRYKLVVYHSINKGELFDLEADPQEHNNLWEDPDYAAIRSELILKSFNQHVNLTTDVGSERIAPM